MSGEAIERPIRVVYVEDDKDISFPISQILTMLGYEVICANNGEQGAANILLDGICPKSDVNSS